MILRSFPSASLLKFFILILLAGCVSTAFSHDEYDVYSLPDDSVKVQHLYDIAYGLEIEFPDSAIAMYELGAQISKQVNYTIGHGRGLQYKGIVLSDQGIYDEAIDFYQQSIAVFKTIPYEVGVASTYVNIGLIYKRKAEFILAFDNILQGTRVFEQIGDTSRLILAYTSVGAILSDVEQFEKSAYYQSKSLELSYLFGDSLSICDGLINLGAIDVTNNELDKALEKYTEGLIIADILQEPRTLAMIHNGLSEIMTFKKNHSQALIHSQKSLGYSEIIGDPAIYTMALARTGMNFNEKEQLDSAEHYLQQSIDIAIEYSISETLRSSYFWMAQLQEKLNNYQKALKNFQEFQNLEEAETGDRQMRVLSGLEIQFETEKKDLEIVKQNLTIERNEALLSERNSFIFALIGALISLFIFFVLIRRSLKQKKELAEKDATLHQDKVIQLKKEQEVVVLKSMMDGEEKERTRLAKDLHDGLGGLLSVVKLHYSNVDSEDFKQSSDYQKGLSLLDNVSSEARKISHNLMPGALTKFGLVDALRDYCDQIKNSNKLMLDFQVYNLEERLSQELETNVFRIVQELVNNIIKHAKAQEVIVQLMKNDNQLHITVEDNGIGFNFEELQNPGIGLSNMQSRVAFLGGDIEFDSAPNEGTTVQIQIPIN